MLLRYVFSVLLALSISLVSACGWHLRGFAPGDTSGLPDALRLSSPGRYSEMTLTMLDEMQKYGIDEDDAAALHLHLQGERLEKRTVAVNTIGSASQYELSLSVHYYFSQNTENDTLPILQTVSTLRVFDFDPGNTVSKAEEENQLIQEMRRELARRIISASKPATEVADAS